MNTGPETSCSPEGVQNIFPFKGMLHGIRLCNVGTAKVSLVIKELNELHQKRSTDLAKMMALIKRVADHGPIRNRQKYKEHLEGQRFGELKSGQLRVPFYRDGSEYILLGAFVKQQDKWKPQEIKRAASRMKLDKTIATKNKN